MNNFFLRLLVTLGLFLPQVGAKPVQTIGLNFTAASLSDVIDSTLNPPPNGQGWVGPKQYVMMCYGAIKSFDKCTGEPDGILDIDPASFFGVVPYDVRISYSRFLDRWFLSCEVYDYSTEIVYAIRLGWSDSGVITPETVWSFHTFNNAELVPQNTQPGPDADLDYDQLSTDANAVYLSTATYDGTTFEFIGSSIVVIPNSSFCEGSPFNYTIFDGVLGPSYPAPLQSIHLPPADNFDREAQFGYLINSAYENTNSGQTLSLFRILNPGTNPTLGSLVTITVPIYAEGILNAEVPPFIYNPLGNAPHKGNLYGIQGYLETGEFGQLEAPHVRNKQLYVCHPITVNSNGVGDPNGDRGAIRWYQFDLTGDPTGRGQGIETETTVPWLVQVGTLFDPSALNPLFYFVPSIMTNKKGDLVIEGTVSGENAYTNVFYAGRKATDSLGTLRDPVLVTNNTKYANNCELVRPYEGYIGQCWGDLTSLCPDPTNDLDIWSTGEWNAHDNVWAIQATQLKPVH